MVGAGREGGIQSIMTQKGQTFDMIYFQNVFSKNHELMFLVNSIRITNTQINGL